VIPISELYAGSYATVLDPLEVLTEIEFTYLPRYAAFLELCRRHNDFAVISVACVGQRDDSGRWTDVRLGLGGMAATPVLALSAGEALSGSKLDDEAIVRASEAVMEIIDPSTDIRASADYRQHIAPIYVRRVLTTLRDAPIA
jgi:carbon-monoxide dehydrogenase medium subunit